ncbi:hypothetical protein BU17DRAFT_69864 [Hysterangium stoloniferum]|nr:hypothetical protein BU17DRAFT_69864 [Hysterangium stoloniferum]
MDRVPCDEGSPSAMYKTLRISNTGPTRSEYMMCMAAWGNAQGDARVPRRALELRATFGSGVRGCIGLCKGEYLFGSSVIEMQAVLIELLDNFEFSPPPGDVKILRAAGGIVSPMVEGSTDKHSKLPVTVTSI